MTMYRKKSTMVEAHQWFKNGDHPQDGNVDLEGKVVRRYRTPAGDGQHQCERCGDPMHKHGWLESEIRGRSHRWVICPSDWILGKNGRYYPLDPDTFEATHNAVSTMETLEAARVLLNEVQVTISHNGNLTSLRAELRRFMNEVGRE